MIKKTVKYKDFNGDAREETFYFHVTPSEWVGRVIGEERTFAEKVAEVTDQGREETLLGTPEGKHMLELFEDIILGAYGTRSTDGKRFIKTEADRKDFRESAAYDQLFIELVMDPVAMAAFIDALIPPEIRAAIDAKEAETKTTAPTPLMAVPALAPVEPTPTDAPQPASQRLMTAEEWAAQQTQQ